MDNFDPYNVLLAIATNIPVLLMTAFVLKGHTYIYIYIYIYVKRHLNQCQRESRFRINICFKNCRKASKQLSCVAPPTVNSHWSLSHWCILNIKYVLIG